MSSSDIAPTTRQAIAPRDRSRALHVTGKVRVAIEAMVWDALPRRAAADRAGISEHGLYKAMRKPPVKALYLELLQVLRESERARNIHALVAVRDDADNAMARVQAVKALEGIGADDQAAGARAQAPGIVIMIGAPAPDTGGPPPVTICPDK